MRSIRTHCSRFVPDDVVFLAVDHEYHENAYLISIDKAEKLIIVCSPKREEDVSRAIDLMNMDPFPPADGFEWSRFMQMWSKVPIG